MYPRLLASAILLTLLPGSIMAAEPPPAGPPWVRELAAAQKTALENNTPIFIYFTKTHCPHCVPIEKNVLPSDQLKPAYGKVSWLYNNRKFDGSPADRIAEKIEERFGISSYPHLLLVDPEKLTILRELGRSEQALLAGFEQTKVKVTNATQAIEQLRQAEEKVAKLEKSSAGLDAKDCLEDDDIVVRLTALHILIKQEPKAVVARSVELLKVQHDPFRYQVLAALAKSGDQSAAPALHSLLESPTGSLNPNVLRIQTALALAKCGTEDSVPVLAKFATTGNYNNYLTGQAVSVLTSTAARLPKTKNAVKDVLVQAYPILPDGLTAGEKERCIELAKKVHLSLESVTKKKVRFPSDYNNATREQLMKGW